MTRTACSSCGCSCQTFIDFPPIPVPNPLGTSPIPFPSDSEARLIQATIHRLHDDLWRLNNEVNRVQTLLHNLTRNRDALSTYYDSQKALIALIRRIPPEILSEIFSSSLTFHLESGAAFPTRKDVLLPGQICRHWRDVAISTPRLWSALEFDLSIHKELEMAQTWLARSGSVALTLALDSYHEMPQTHPITDVVLAYAPRIYCLIFKAPQAILHGLRGAMGQIPCLRRLILEIRYSHLSPIPSSLDTFQIAPKLCYLELRSRVSIQIPNIPWAQLLELHLLDYEYMVDDVFQMLHNSPNLVSFDMELGSEERLDDTIVRHSNLRELDATVYDIAPLFNGLSLPALTSLSCRWCNHWPRDAFLSFLHRSSFSLQRLVLDTGKGLDEYYARNVLECLQHTPNLLELELLDGSGEVGNTFWNGMSLNHHDLLVPKLRRIEVTRCFDFDYTAFVDMVESRWRLNSVPGTVHDTAVEKIRTVEVSLLDPHSYDDRDTYECVDLGGEYFVRLRQFRMEGLEVIAPDMDTARHSSSSASSFDKDSGQDDRTQ